jgi:Mg2+ and Co2+ transporter CorA
VASIYGMNIIVSEHTHLVHLVVVLVVLVVIMMLMLQWTRRQGWW